MGVGGRDRRTWLEPLAEAQLQNLLFPTLTHLRNGHQSFQAIGLLISENLLMSTS